MRTRLIGILVLAVGACGEDAPSCNQAVTHYYAQGCAAVDLTNGGAIVPKETMIVGCLNLVASAPRSCDAELDDFLICLGTVEESPTPVSSQCDCTSEQEELLRCS